MRLVRLKQLHIIGDNESCCCNWKYIEQKSKEVYNKTLKRAGLNPKFWIIEWETEPGYLSQDSGKLVSRILKERQVTQEFIEQILSS